MKNISIYLGVFITSLLLVGSLSSDISYHDFKDYLSNLLNVSSMVFTIMGIWIAFLYPNALHRLVNPKKIAHVDFTESLQETRRLEGLVGAVLKSAFVVSMIILGMLIKLILSPSQIYGAYNHYIKTFSLASIITLTYLQAESMFHVISSNISFLADLHNKREERAADSDV